MKGLQERCMRRAMVLVSLLCLLAILPLASGIEQGRAPPSCQTIGDLSQAVFQLDDGDCATYNIGTLSSGQVLEFDFTVSADAIDIMLMTSNVYEAYIGGHAYGHVIEAASLLAVEGTQYFHWSPDANDINKQFYLVFDNLAHDNDASEGDQGGSTSTVQASMMQMQDSYWTDFHNIVVMDIGTHIELLGGDELSLDAGTQVNVTVWPMSGEPDIYLMTEQHRTTYLNGDSGAFYVPGASLTSINSQTSMRWTITQEQEGQPMYLMLDNEASPAGGGPGSSEARVTVRIDLLPVWNPIISDNLDSQAAIMGQSVELNALSSPNRQGQIQSLEWDLDVAVDSDGDGTLDNDLDATGWIVSKSWTSPGNQRVKLTVTSPDGQQAQATYDVSVIDVLPPVVSITHDTSSNTMNEALAPVGELITFTAGISDDHTVAGKRWTLDGVEVSSGDEWSKGWMSPSTHTLILEATDVSGNKANATLVINVIDTTEPQLDVTKVTVPVSVTAGEGFTLSAVGAASDTFDDDSDLEYRWDLDLDVDLDGDGIKDNDPELTGQTVKVILPNVGETSIRLTIVDPSGNFVTKGYTIQVEDPPESNTTMIISIIIIILVAVGGVGAFMWRQKEMGLARQLLASHGLNAEEIDTRIQNVLANSNLSFFAKAVDLAGLSHGEDQPLTEEQRAILARKAEMERLYGSQSSGDPNAGFMPAGSGRASSDADFAAMAGVGSGPELDTAQLAAATEAAALFDDQTKGQAPTKKEVPEIPDSALGDDGILEQIEQKAAASEPAQSVQARSGGISIPGQQQATPKPKPKPKPKPSGMRGSCSSCGQGFMVQLPDGVNEVLVDCPKCGVEQHFSR